MGALHAFLVHHAVALDTQGMDEFSTSFILEWFENVFSDPEFKGDTESLAEQIVTASLERGEIESLENRAVVEAFLVAYGQLVEKEGRLFAHHDEFEKLTVILDAQIDAGLE